MSTEQFDDCDFQRLQTDYGIVQNIGFLVYYDLPIQIFCSYHTNRGKARSFGSWLTIDITIARSRQLHKAVALLGLNHY